MTPRPTTLTFTPWGVLYPTTTPADAGGKYTRYMHINDPLTATK